jgi:hypothetical protein
MRIRRRDGRFADVDDGYILADGEGYAVPLLMMDGSRRGIVRDSRGNPAGQRPGFLYSDSNETALEAAHAAYRAGIEQRWQSGRWQSEPSKPAPSQPAFDGSEAARIASYEAYRNDIENRWRK